MVEAKEDPSLDSLILVLTARSFSFSAPELRRVSKTETPDSFLVLALSSFLRRKTRLLPLTSISLTSLALILATASDNEISEGFLIEELKNATINEVDNRIKKTMAMYLIKGLICPSIDAVLLHKKRSLANKRGLDSRRALRALSPGRDPPLPLFLSALLLRLLFLVLSRCHASCIASGP